MSENNFSDYFLFYFYIITMEKMISQIRENIKKTNEEEELIQQTLKETSKNNINLRNTDKELFYYIIGVLIGIIIFCVFIIIGAF